MGATGPPLFCARVDFSLSLWHEQIAQEGSCGKSTSLTLLSLADRAPSGERCVREFASPKCDAQPPELRVTQLRGMSVSRRESVRKREPGGLRLQPLRVGVKKSPARNTRRAGPLLRTLTRYV